VSFRATFKRDTNDASLFSETFFERDYVWACTGICLVEEILICGQLFARLIADN